MDFRAFYRNLWQTDDEREFDYSLVMILGGMAARRSSNLPDFQAKRENLEDVLLVDLFHSFTN